MPLQNRVDPFGAIHAVSARGLFTGNRGVIHDPATKTLLARRWSTKAWIICRCAFEGRHRDVMGRNGRTGGAGWTELFFLDEVTALAAGHRPCFYCRREEALRFSCCFAQRQNGPKQPAPDLDARLHGERRASGGATIPLEPDRIAGLPDGAMVEHDGHAYALRAGRLLPWHFTGYGAPMDAREPRGPFTLLTPLATVRALECGYRPVWHASARS